MPLKKLVAATLRFLAHDEAHRELRTRKRRPADQAAFERSVETVVCNLAYAVVMPPENGRLAILTGNQLRGRSRYENHKALGSKPFRHLLHQLEHVQFLEFNPSPGRGESSSVKPTPWFVRKVQEHGVALAHFGRDTNEEVILLNRAKSTGPKPDQALSQRERVNYKDTAETHAFRDEIRRLNAFLAAADIDFVDDGLQPRVDPYRRSLRRYFTILPGQKVRFDQNGRLFGGFWLEMRSERRAGIRMNGEPCVTLDYSAMFTRLAYAHLKVTPPPGDPYAIEGAEGYRSGIKLAMNTFLFDTHNRRRRWPSAMGVGVGSDADAEADPHSLAAQYERRLPAGWTVAVTRKAILKKHPALADAWGQSLGYHLMFVESRVLLAALHKLMAKNIPALGLHDGLMVQASKREEARRAMVEAAREITGAELPVSDK